MSDYTTINLQYNTGSDASPTWTGTAIAFNTANNELRWANSGASTSTASANWPFITRGASNAAVTQLWAFTADTTGSQIATYTGDNAKNNVLRWNFDANGTLAAAFQFSAFGDTTHTAPSPGTQPGGQSGSPVVNGHATDTSSTSYLKINAYGYGVDTGGTQQTPPTSGSVGTLPTGTTGAAGGTATTTGDWLNTHGAWQSAQGWTQYIVDNVICKALTAGYWYWTCILFVGPNMSTASTILPVITLQYSYS